MEAWQLLILKFIGGGGVTVLVYCIFKYVMRNNPLEIEEEYDDSGNVKKSKRRYR